MDNIMEKYFRKLIEEFVNARGVKSSDMKSDDFIADFHQWIKERKKIGLQYVCFLDHLGFDYKELNCAEIGKSGYDSIVVPYNTTIISRVPNTFDFTIRSKVASGNMKVIHNEPTFINQHGKLKVIPESVLRAYMTQNPFSMQNIDGWDDLHNSKRSNIIVGVYGSIHDKDYEKKIHQIDLFLKQLDEDYVEEYASLGENYFYAVGSRGLVKQLVHRR